MYSLDNFDQIVKNLNITLANLHLYYQKLRNFHWNVEGENFFDLHDFFQKGYEMVADDIDEVAERIRALGQKPMSNLSDYLRTAQIKESDINLSDFEMQNAILADQQIITTSIKAVIDAAQIDKDSATEHMFSEMLKKYEKDHWMLKSFSKKRTTP